MTDETSGCAPTPTHLIDQQAAAARNAGVTRNTAIVCAKSTESLAALFDSLAEHFGPGHHVTLEWVSHQLRHHAADMLRIADTLPRTHA